MNFAYKEEGESKNALVKLRVCPGATPACAARRNQIQRTATSVHFVPATRFVVFDFAARYPPTPCP
eukprot:681612-Rhodomonas_salina.1